MHIQCCSWKRVESRIKFSFVRQTRDSCYGLHGNKPMHQSQYANPHTEQVDQTILNPVLRLVRRSPWEVMKTRTDSTSRSFKIKKKKRSVEFLFRHLEHLDNNQFCFQQYFNTFHDDSLTKSWLSHLVLWALVRWKQTNKQIMPTSFTHIKIHPGGIPK